MFIEVKDEDEMKALGEAVGKLLHGGEIIELIGDVGAGKTTFVKGLAVGLGVNGDIQSPSFTINRVYDGRDSIMLNHYDFYRLDNSGIMNNELQEVISSPQTVTAIEWSGAIKDVLPIDRLSIIITATADDSRKVNLVSDGEISKYIVESLKI